MPVPAQSRIARACFRLAPARLRLPTRRFRPACVPSLVAALAATCASGVAAQESAFVQTRGWIGVRFDVASQSVVVSEVFRSGPADRGGVRPGDVVAAVDGASVAGGGLARAVSGLVPGQMLRLTVVREGAEHRLTVVATRRPASIDAELAADRFAQAQSRLFRTMDSLLRVLSTGEAELGGGGGPTAERSGVAARAVTGLRSMPPRASRSPFVLGGARARDLSAELGRYFGVGAGVLVTDVLATTPAAMAGFQPGDVIVSLAGRELQTLTELRAALRSSPVPYDLTVVRQGSRVVVRYPRGR